MISAHGVTITDAALMQLAVHAAEQVEGVRVRRRRDVDVGEDAVTLAIAARHGEVLPDVAREVQARMTDAFREMCGVTLRAVDVSVEELDE
jgi:uncharacterized alkaline shock family protein YloU